MPKRPVCPTAPFVLESKGKQHADRDAQFKHINARVKARKRRGEPALSVDTKKKENLGNKSNVGQEYEPKGQPRQTDTHDFPDKTKGKAVPYGGDGAGPEMEESARAYGGGLWVQVA